MKESRGGKKPSNDVRSFSNGGGDRRDVATTFMGIAQKFGEKKKELKSLQVGRSNLTQPFGAFWPKRKCYSMDVTLLEKPTSLLCFVRHLIDTLK